MNTDHKICSVSVTFNLNILDKEQATCVRQVDPESCETLSSLLFSPYLIKYMMYCECGLKSCDVIFF